MPAEVTVHINELTGECEVRIEHESDLPPDQHNAEAERIAAQIGRLFDRAPRIDTESPPPAVPDPGGKPVGRDDETAQERRRQRGQQG